MVEEQKTFDYLSIPGWDDIVHIRPPPTITQGEMDEHRRRLKKKEPSNLSPRQLDYLQKKRERYLRMKASPTPEIVKCISKIMTDYDDLEDGLITAAVVGRLAVKLLPRLMGRFIPVIGWCLLAADVINLFQIMSWLPFFGMSAKRVKEGLTERNPLGRTARLKRVARIKRVKPSFGEILEVAQTTDQLFGVGICLGGIMGYITDAASALFKGLTQPIPKTLWSEASRGFFATMKSTMVVNTCDRELTDEEKYNALVAFKMGQRNLKPYMDDFDWYGAAETYSNIPIEATHSSHPSTLFILEEAGEDIEETTRWPIKGTPKEVTLSEFVEYAFPIINQTLKSFCDRMKKTPEGFIASHCLHEGLYDTLLIWEGHNPYSTEFYRREKERVYVHLMDGGSFISNPEKGYNYSQTEKDGMNKEILEKGQTDVERIASILLENGILPHPGTTLEELEIFFDRACFIDRACKIKQTPEELLELYKMYLGKYRQYYPIYPKNASFRFTTNQEEFSESFRKNMFEKGSVLWPNWELMPQDAIEYYMRYGLL